MLSLPLPVLLHFHTLATVNTKNVLSEAPTKKYGSAFLIYLDYSHEYRHMPLSVLPPYTPQYSETCELYLAPTLGYQRRMGALLIRMIAS